MGEGAKEYHDIDWENAVVSPRVLALSSSFPMSRTTCTRSLAMRLVVTEFVGNVLWANLTSFLLFPWAEFHLFGALTYIALRRF